MGARIERIILYIVVLALAGAVVWLALATQDDGKGPGADCDGCEEGLRDRLAAMGEAMDRLGETVAAVGDAVVRGLAGFERKLAGLDGMEGRIADAVAGRLLAEGCCAAGAEECAERPPTPCPPGPVKVDSRFTFFYGNARLNEDGKVGRDSFGVKLAPRHLKRLRLLASAFRPCHQEDDPVRFSVAGYSSGAEFRSRPDGRPLANSEDLNRRTAELREEVVGDYLREQGFEVVPPPKYDLPRPYREDPRLGVSQQALNRTVFVAVESPGACGRSR